MTNKLFLLILLQSFILFNSCLNRSPKKLHGSTSDKSQKLPSNEPNFNYYVEVPENWEIVDTIMNDGMRIKLIKAPITLLLDSPFANILITYMEDRNIEDFTTRNINYLKSNREGITILEIGNIDGTKYNGKWFTYSKEENGTSRDMINYIIPQDGFAYMITGQTSKGKMRKYRGIFDRIAKSFKG